MDATLHQLFEHDVWSRIVDARVRNACHLADESALATTSRGYRFIVNDNERSVATIVKDMHQLMVDVRVDMVDDECCRRTIDAAITSRRAFEWRDEVRLALPSFAALCSYIPTTQDHVIEEWRALDMNSTTTTSLSDMAHLFNYTHALQALSVV